jgi:hypothetical protein
MHAELFTVASEAEVSGGLLSMTDGGWEYVKVDWFPAQITVVLVGVLVYAPEDYGRKHVISVAVQGSDGRSADFGTIRVLPSTAAAVVKTPFAYPLSLTLQGPVVLSITATVEDGPTLGPVEFEVRPPR